MRQLIRSEAPLFAAFFVSAIGAGGSTIVRPLFSASFGVSLFFVALINTAGPVARLVAAPIAGALSDRVGRRPLAMTGLAIRSLFSFISFFATSYPQFLLFEFIGSIGLSVWTTAGTIVVADVSSNINRGRAVALRTSSQRLGNMIGPIIAGILGQAFGLRFIFLVNAFGKFGAFLIFLFMIGESRPESAATAASAPNRRRTSVFPKREDIAKFMNGPVLVVLFATAAINVVSGAGAFESLFPIHVRDEAGFSTADIGWMVSVVALATFLVSVPNGIMMDKLGRKASLLPGMLILGLASFLIAGGRDFTSILIAVIILGLGEGMCQGTLQVLAMDLAPEDSRGAFLGVWQFLTSVAGIIVPLALGTFGSNFGTTSTFIAAAVVVLVAVPMLGLFVPETKAASPAETTAAG